MEQKLRVIVVKETNNPPKKKAGETIMIELKDNPEEITDPVLQIQGQLNKLSVDKEKVIQFLHKANYDTFQE